MEIAIVVLSVVGVMLFGYFLVNRMDVFLKRNGTPGETQARDDEESPPFGEASRPSSSPDAERVRQTFENDGVWFSDSGSAPPEDKEKPRRWKKR